MTFEQAWMVFIGAVITGAVGAIFSFAKEIRLKHEQEQDEKNETIRILMEREEKAQEWRKKTEERLADLMADNKKLFKHIENMTEADKAILRDRIVQSCRVFLERGSITLAARDNIRSMYKWYSLMGGNGIGEYYYTQAMKLEVDKSVPNIPYVPVDFHEMEEFLEEHGKKAD